MSTYFVTSTGTGVGKTFATCALLDAMRVQGKIARGYKPVISGWNEDESTDTQQIIAAGGAKQSVDDVSPFRFTAPLSPHRAAALESKTIDVSALEQWCRARADEDGVILIEGAGGVMAPITNDYTMLDLMAALKLPVVLVVGSYLGAISHTLSALEVLRARGLSIKALIMSESEGSEVTFAEAQAGLAPFISDIELRYFQPRVSSWKEAHALHALVEHL